MVSSELLVSAIKDKGFTMKDIAEQIGITRRTLYHKINGDNEFTISEMLALSNLLALSKDNRDQIFLQ